MSKYLQVYTVRDEKVLEYELMWEVAEHLRKHPELKIKQIEYFGRIQYKATTVAVVYEDKPTKKPTD